MEPGVLARPVVVHKKLVDRIFKPAALKAR